MKNIGLILIVLLLSACTSSRYTCADVYHTKKEKIPLKYRLGTNHKSTKATQPESSEPITELSVPVASISKVSPLTTFQLREREIKALIEKNVEAVELDSAVAIPPTEQNLSKKEIKKQLRKELSVLNTKGVDPTYDKAKTLAIVSFASSIVGLIFFPLSIVGLVTGIISLKRYKETTNKENRIFALLGVIFSSIYIALIILAIIVVLWLLSDFGSWS